MIYLCNRKINQKSFKNITKMKTLDRTQKEDMKIKLANGYSYTEEEVAEFKGMCNLRFVCNISEKNKQILKPYLRTNEPMLDIRTEGNAFAKYYEIVMFRKSLFSLLSELEGVRFMYTENRNWNISGTSISKDVENKDSFDNFGIGITISDIPYEIRASEFVNFLHKEPKIETVVFLHENAGINERVKIEEIHKFFSDNL